MIQNKKELKAAFERIQNFQQQIVHMRELETNPVNYRFSAGGYLAELDRMNLEVRDYLSLHPSEFDDSTNIAAAAA